MILQQVNLANNVARFHEINQELEHFDLCIKIVQYQKEVLSSCRSELSKVIRNYEILKQALNDKRNMIDIRGCMVKDSSSLVKRLSESREVTNLLVNNQMNGYLSALKQICERHTLKLNQTKLEENICHSKKLISNVYLELSNIQCRRS